MKIAFPALAYIFVKGRRNHFLKCLLDEEGQRKA
jgi:hypothetical protein